MTISIKELKATVERNSQADRFDLADLAPDMAEALIAAEGPARALKAFLHEGFAEVELRKRFDGATVNDILQGRAALAAYREKAKP
jgi:hypothetical protein